MLGRLEIYRIDYLRRLKGAAVRLELEDTAANIQKRLNALGANIYERRRLDYAREFVAKNVHRAKSQGKSFKRWISLRTTMVAMEVIIYEMSDLALLDFVASFATKTHVAGYIRDKKRGLHSSCDILSRKKRRGFVDGFVHGWRTKFPTVIRFPNDTVTDAHVLEFTAVLSGQYGPFGSTPS